MAKSEPGKLWVVATPIGNLRDITERAREVLQSVDAIAAEDTRHSLRLFQEIGVQKPLHSLHEHSTRQKVAALAERIARGETWAYVSDAGTPAISDPGAALVAECHARGITVSPVPGPAAVTALLSVSGCEATGYRFHGFFPRENSERKKLLASINAAGGVHVFYESPHRMKELLEVSAATLPGETALIIGRELTKKFEEVKRGTLAEIAPLYLEREEMLGEFVLAFELPVKDVAPSAPHSRDEIVKFLEDLSGLGAQQKILVAAGRFAGLSRAEAYDLALQLKGKSGH